jgi:diguanylate cyclase (GGDEF)-like protein
MRRIAEVAGRILRPLSRLLDRRLQLDEGAAAAGDMTVVSVAAPAVVVRAEDGRPFNEAERQLLDEIFALARLADESDNRLRALEDRFLILQRENLDLVMKNRILSEISHKDALTGLYNRFYVMEKIDSEMNRALRHGYPISVLMLDLDHFKRINDSYGHPVGDEVLKTVGQVLRDSCRVYDVAGRYGGEEFCIVLPETQVGNTTQVAERIRNRLATTPLSVGNASIVVTASIGVAGMDSTEGVLSASTLVERADRALYSAKHLGRNRVEMWNPAATGPQEMSH